MFTPSKPTHARARVYVCVCVCVCVRVRVCVRECQLRRLQPYGDIYNLGLMERDVSGLTMAVEGHPVRTL
jgi:hypothetical protein